MLICANATKVGTGWVGPGYMKSILTPYTAPSQYLHTTPFACWYINENYK